ncbi:Nucleoporin NDC1 [Trichoplax sp. H2]|nr:Nucleoporin NDC1 [Trichoplax sp. H2]|eukprot:RDD40216.1 Nucleoporin NDC1 [Trichoplax sp. H2]
MDSDPSTIDYLVQSRSVKIRKEAQWFLHGVYRWRCIAAILWMLMLLPIICFTYVAVVQFHPFNLQHWMLTFLSSIASLHAWIMVFLLSLNLVLFGIIYAASFKVVKAIKIERLAILSYKYRPSRIALAIFYMISGVTSVWCFSNIVDSEFSSIIIHCNASNEHSWPSLDYCVNEKCLLMLAFGACMGLTYGLQYISNEMDYLQFPVVQQHKVFRIKLYLSNCLAIPLRLTLKVLRGFYIFYYLMGKTLLQYTEFILHTSKSESAMASIISLLDLKLFLTLTLTGSILILLWDLTYNLLNIFLTQVLTFPVESQFANERFRTLSWALQCKEIPLLRYLGFLDLALLSGHAVERRQQIFSLSHPGGHPRNWQAVATECFDVVEDLIQRVTRAADMICHNPPDLRDDLPEDNNMLHDNPDAALRLRRNTEPISERMLFTSTLATPSPLSGNKDIGSRIWSRSPDTVARKSRNSFRQRIIDNVTVAYNKILEMYYMAPYKIASFPQKIRIRLRHSFILRYFLDKLPEASLYELYGNCQPQIFSIDALSLLAVASIDEDKFGVVQKSLKDIMSMLIRLYQVMEKQSSISKNYSTNPVRSLTIKRIPGEIYRNKLKTAVEAAILRLIVAFKNNLSDFHLGKSELNTLEVIAEKSGYEEMIQSTTWISATR